MSIELKIKGLTLAQEARIIRNYERKLRKYKPVSVTLARSDWRDETGALPPREKVCIHPGNLKAWNGWAFVKFRSLQEHRRGIVRSTSRNTHLARMFLKGTPYRAAEQTVKPSNWLSPKDWDAIHTMARRYARYGSGEGEFRDSQDLAQKFEEWRQG